MPARPFSSKTKTILSGAMRCSSLPAAAGSSRIRRPCRWRAGSWTRCSLCPTPDITIPIMKPWAALPPSRRFAFPSSTTGAASAPAIFARLPCIRAAMSPPAASSPFWRRPGRSLQTRISRAISTMWAAPQPTLTIRPAQSRRSTGPAPSGSVFFQRPAPISTPTKAAI